MKYIDLKRTITVVFLLCMTIVTNAQDTAKPNTDFMRSNGRSYVVIAVMLTILTGLILYLIRLDKKLSKLEKD